MRKIALTLLVALFAWAASAQNLVNVEITDGIANASLRTSIEKQLSKLLTAINMAESQRGDINFYGIDISDVASQTLTSLWANARFRVVDDDIVERGIQQRRAGRVFGYQVRNIMVEMEATDEAYTDDVNQEVNVDFDQNGKIVDFNVSIDKQQYVRILREGFDVNDIDERTTIVKVCERLATAYCNKDIKAIDDFFSDDALIITGRVITRVKRETGVMETDVVFSQRSKAEYLRNLRSIFSNPKTGEVYVDFPDIRIKRHGAKPHYYAVTARQIWKTGTYSDEGTVVLLFDFEDAEHPRIEVRTWQPLGTDVQKAFQYIDNIKRY